MTRQMHVVVQKAVDRAFALLQWVYRYKRHTDNTKYFRIQQDTREGCSVCHKVKIFRDDLSHHSQQLSCMEQPFRLQCS